MPHARNLVYLLVDAAHARVVRRSAESGRFVTIGRMQGEDALDQARARRRGERPGRAFESANAGRHAVGREDAYRRAKESFAAEVGRQLGDVLNEPDVEGVVLAAPPRLLRAVRRSLPTHTNVVAEIGKDLIKTPDDELDAWLGPMALAANS